MSFAALHKRVTYLFALLGFGTLALGAELGAPVLLTFGVGFVASWFFESPRIDSARHREVVTAVALGLFVVEGLRAIAGADPIALVLEYLGALQLTRLFTRRTSTEHLHVVALGLLHLLAGTLLSTGLDYAFVFVGFVVVTPWMLTLTHLRAELERRFATPSELALSVPEPLREQLASPGVASRRILVGSSLLAVPAFLITATFFLLFPRVGLGMFSFGGVRGESVAGFGSSVDLGQFGTIRDDPSVAVRVYPEPSAATPASRAIRLRGTAFDRYDGIRWSRTPSTPSTIRADYGGIVWLDPRRPALAPERSIRIVADVLEEGVVFLPPSTRALRIAPRIERGLVAARSVVVRRGLDVRMLEVDSTKIEYEALVDPNGEDVGESLAPDERARLLEVPLGLERLRGLARDVARGETEDARVAERVLAFLRDGSRLRYSLAIDDAGDDDPLEHFLFVSRRGHCELFASAMVMMLRARGIPARNVTGFLGGRFNAFGGYYALTHGDAHSWVEAYVDGAFRTYDPTPPSRDAAMPAHSPFDSLRAFADAMRVRWSRDVVGFDMQRQLTLVRSVARFFRRDGDVSRRWVEVERTDRGGEGVRAPPLGVAVVLGVVLVFVVAWFVRRRGTVVVRAEAEVAYEALDRALRRVGLGRPPSRSPAEHARFVEAMGFEEAPSVATITEAYARARYAGASWDEGTRREVRDAMRKVRRARSRLNST